MKLLKSHFYRKENDQLTDFFKIKNRINKHIYATCIYKTFFGLTTNTSAAESIMVIEFF